MKQKLRMAQPLGQRHACLIARIVVAIGGSYACTVAIAGLCAVLLSLLGGLPRGEAVILAAMLGFVLYLVLLIWSFAAPSLSRLSLLLASGTLMGSGLKYWLTPMLTLPMPVGS